MQNHPFFQYNDTFQTFGTQHLMILGLVALLSFLIPWLSIRYLNYFQKIWVSRGLAILVSFWVIFWTLIYAWLGDFEWSLHLPLDICNIVALTLPFLMWMPKFKIHEIIYFWILAGTLQALLTPHLSNNYPNFEWWKYWVVHGGLVVYAIYITVVFKMYPTWKSLWKSFFFANCYLVFVYIMNNLLGSNYAYLMGKPPVASALDLMGPYPWYILTGQGVAVVLFLIAWLPVWVFGRSHLR